MGSPNVVLGGSHSGNVGAGDLARQGLLDALTSDYVPSSLLHAAFIIGRDAGDLTAGVRMVTETPAAITGLDDRGTLRPGARADILQVRLIDDVPVIRAVWVAGARRL